MGITAIYRIPQLVDNMLWRGLVRIAHAEINNIFTTSAGCLLQLADDIENIRRQALYTLKVCIQNMCSRLLGLAQSNPSTAARSDAGR